MSENKTFKSIRIFLAMNDKVVCRAIEVQPVLSDVEFVEKVGEADLIIFNDVRRVEREYDPSKTYAFFFVGGKVPPLPSGCVVIELMRVLPGLATAIDTARKRLEERVPVIELKAPTVDIVPIRPDALRILVVDDTPKHIVSARTGLANHNLTTVTGYEQAMSVLENERFDVVLTDLHMPMSSKTLGTDAFYLGGLVPYGILLMVEAARCGAKFVAVVTDLNHHSDPFSAAFDHYSRFPVTIDGAKVVMMHAPMCDGAKDWATALERLMKE